MEHTPGTTHGATATHTVAPVGTTTTTADDLGRVGTAERYEDRRYDDDAVRFDHDERGWVHRISGAAIWSGLAVGLAVWILLELALAAVDLVPLGLSGSQYDTSELWWTGGASVLALFVGGLVAGAGGRWHHAVDGALQGVVTWAATVVGILVLVALGAGIGFGAFGESLSNAENQSNIGIDQQQQAEDQGFVLSQSQVEESAGLAALFLGLTVVGAALGGVIGSKMSATGSERTRIRVEATTRR